MNRSFAGVFALIVSLGNIGAVSAADMAVKARSAAIAPVYAWSGWYAGLNAGAAVNDSSYNLDPTGCYLLGCGVGGFAGQPARTYSTSLSGTGFTGGGQIGYNHQFSSAWVAGLEADVNYNGLRQSDAVVQNLPPPIYFAGSTFVHTVTTSLDWFGTLRGRVGLLASPNILLYGTGGLAYGQVRSSTIAVFPPPNAGDTYPGSMSTTRAGWTAGGGGEWLVGGNWSLKAEYLYVDLGRNSYAAPCVSAICTAFAVNPSYTTTVTTREHVVRVGVNYHLGGPVVAKY
jgi:outer membrane immunogenic protein